MKIDYSQNNALHIKADAFTLHKQNERFEI